MKRVLSAPDSASAQSVGLLKKVQAIISRMVDLDRDSRRGVKIKTVWTAVRFRRFEAGGRREALPPSKARPFGLFTKDVRALGHQQLGGNQLTSPRCPLRRPHESEDVLCKIETDCCNVSHGRLPSLVVFDNHHLGTSMPLGGHPPSV